jgi:SAM-dependent methyltransferase
MKMIKYADITINDSNPIKRKLQYIRLSHSIKLFKHLPRNFSGSILDIGTGDATLSKQIAEIWPDADIFAYEPAVELREQARKNARNYKNISIVDSLSKIPIESFDYIFCLEVLEHLPETEVENLFKELLRFSDAKTTIVIGVPNEIFLAALVKGPFRMTRRFGDVDASPLNILKSILGFPPENRPVGLLSEGVPYIFRHMGFDYRRLGNTIKERFQILATYGSPWPSLPLFFNFEIYFICKIRDVE